MKQKSRVILPSAIFAILLIGSSVRADWVQDGGSLNVNIGMKASSPSLAISNGTPCVAWSEINDWGGIAPPIYEIYVKHWNGTGSP